MLTQTNLSDTRFITTQLDLRCNVASCTDGGIESFHSASSSPTSSDSASSLTRTSSLTSSHSSVTFVEPLISGLKMADRVVNDINTELDRLAHSRPTPTAPRQDQVCPIDDINSRLDHLRDSTSLCSASISCADSVPQKWLEAHSELRLRTQLHLCVESAEAWLVKVTLTRCQSHSYQA